MTPASQADRVHRLLLPADTSAAGAGRRFVRARIADTAPIDAVDTAELLTSEIVTNAVLHTTAPRTLVLVVQPDRIRVEVEDGSERLPVRRRGLPATSLSGRGLLLVEALASTWGVDRLRSGKRVWFELTW